MAVASFEFDCSHVQDLHTGLLVRARPRCHDSQCPWELDWLRLPLTTLTSQASNFPTVVSTTSTTTFAQWHHRFEHISDLRISTRVGSGVLGTIFDDEILHCAICKLGKPYSDSV